MASPDSKDRGQLEKRAVTATVWSVGSYALTFVIRLGANLVLTRLLSPNDFGLMTLLSTVIAGLYMLSDFGVSTCLIRSPRGDDPAFRDTAWTVTLVRGGGLFVIACALAYPVSRFYETPELVYLLPVLALGNVLLVSFKSTKVALAGRHLNVSRVSRLELICQLTGVAAMIGLAWLHPSVWALVLGSLMGNLVQVVLSFLWFSGRNDRIGWEAAALRELTTFGRWMFLSTALTFFAGQTDRFILAKLIPFATLGVLGIGFQLAELPTQLFARVSGQVVLPVMSQVMHLPRSEFRRLIERQRRRLLPFVAIVLATGCTLSDVAVALLYDDRYAAAGWVAAVMLASTWTGLLAASVDQALVALGKVQYIAYSNAFKVIANFTLIPLGFAWLGVVGAVLGLAAKQVSYYFFIYFGLRREQLSCGRQDLLLSGVFLGTLMLLLGLRSWLGLGHPFALIF